MPLWGFKHEKNIQSAGANVIAGHLAGYQPGAAMTDGKQSNKRNVIATKEGWVRRTIKTTDGAHRMHDEILVAGNPEIASDGYANVAHLAFPDISQIYFSSNSTGGTSLQANATMNVYVVFNEPLRFKGGAGVLRFRLANTVSGNAMQAYANVGNGLLDIINANNTLVFRAKMPWISGKTSTYKVNSNTILANGWSTVLTAGYTSNLVGVNISTNGAEAANLVITGAVSNNAGTITVRAAKSGG